jgi:hypothetical protein
MTRGMLRDKYVKRNDVKRRGTGKHPPPLEEGKNPLGRGRKIVQFPVSEIRFLF